ncbi:MAG: glycosyltransferase [Chlorobiaceae bacterium]
MDKSSVFDIVDLLPGIATAAISMLLVMTKGWHGNHSFDTTTGIQKFHSCQTPRVGGIAIFIGFIAAWLISSGSIATLLGSMLIASLPAFAAGLTEDITKRVGVRTRLIATMISGLVAWKYTGYSIGHLAIPGIDNLLGYLPISIAFTAFAVAGVANAANIIDGFNGLAAGTMMICFSALCVIAGLVGDVELFRICLLLVIVIAGFLILNFPFGKIFMGDGGAYLLGFMLAWVAVMLPQRNPMVSPWAPMLVCSYPIIETIFSMGRRTLNRAHPGHPDIGHLHSLIKIKVVNRYFPNLPQALRNGLVSPFCWLYTLIPSCFSIVFYTQTVFLVVSAAASFLLYALVYRYLVNLNSLDHQQISLKIENED